MILKTDELIALLSAEPERISKHWMAKHFSVFITSGLVLSALLMQVIYGVRSDLAQSALEGYFIIKVLFCASLALPASIAMMALGRPGVHIKWLVLAMGVPFLLMLLLALPSFIEASEAQRHLMIFGQTWRSCPFNIFLLSLPLMFSSLGLSKELAPTRLRQSGACSGFLAGALAALIYCLHCPESDLVFITLWYSMGVLLSMGLGAFLGPKILRW